MLVFVDESGDAGFKLSQGSTVVFALGMVIFRDAKEAERAQACVRNLLSTLSVKPEFKFNKCSGARRDAFFQAIASYSFRVRVIVVRKKLIRSALLKSDTQSFYRFFLKTMLKFDNDVLRRAKVIIDGSGDKAFKRELRRYLRRHIASGAIASVKLRDSESEPLLQLADMCVGAVSRSYRIDRSDPSRWRDQLATKIDDVWEFK